MTKRELQDELGLPAAVDFANMRDMVKRQRAEQAKQQFPAPDTAKPPIPKNSPASNFWIAFKNVKDPAWVDGVKGRCLQCKAKGCGDDFFAPRGNHNSMRDHISKKHRVRGVAMAAWSTTDWEAFVQHGVWPPPGSDESVQREVPKQCHLHQEKGVLPSSSRQQRERETHYNVGAL